MEDIRNSVERYMKLKGIKGYTYLLIDIARELGVTGQDAYDFANREKSNFSKMLKGERPIKYELIVPLEKVLGVSLARLFDENAYKLPVEKDNVPFNKGFRYYAYLDEPQLYKDEFDILLTNDGQSILTQSDEFGKTFLDYVVEYRAVNGVRYLHDGYGIKLKWFHNQFEFTKDKGVTWIQFENCVEFARLVASMNDVRLFNDIFDPYNMFFTNGHYATESCIFCRDDYLEIILDNDGLFKSLFEVKPYELKLDGRARRIKGKDYITHNCINPIINNCLRYALKHLDKYKQRAEAILKFGIRHNKRIADETANDYYYVCGELGELKKCGDIDCYAFYDIVIFADVKTDDDEINALIDKLPVFNKSL